MKPEQYRRTAMKSKNNKKSLAGSTSTALAYAALAADQKEGHSEMVEENACKTQEY